MGVNVLLNLAFVGGALAIGFVGPHAGLALASSVAAVLNASLLFRGLRRSGTYRPVPGWGPLLGAVGLAGVAMVLALRAITPATAEWFALGPLDRALLLTGVIAAGAGVYGATGVLAGLRPRHFARGGH
jgi:putative peptidoglycan lipid II flippase